MKSRFYLVIVMIILFQIQDFPSLMFVISLQRKSFNRQFSNILTSGLVSRTLVRVPLLRTSAVEKPLTAKLAILTSEFVLRKCSPSSPAQDFSQDVAPLPKVILLPIKTTLGLCFPNHVFSDSFKWSRIFVSLSVIFGVVSLCTLISLKNIW